MISKLSMKRFVVGVLQSFLIMEAARAVHAQTVYYEYSSSPSSYSTGSYAPSSSVIIYSPPPASQTYWGESGGTARSAITAPATSTAQKYQPTTFQGSQQRPTFDTGSPLNPVPTISRQFAAASPQRSVPTSNRGWGNAEDVLQIAKSQRHKLEQQVEELNTTLLRLDQRLRSVRSGDLVGGVSTVKSYLDEGVPPLRNLATTLLDELTTVESQLGQLTSSIEDSGPVLQGVASRFKEYAEAASSPFFSQAYLDLAQDMESIAKKLTGPEVVREISSRRAEISGARQFLTESLQFMDRLGEYSESIPFEGTANVQRFTTSLGEFVEGLNSVVSGIKTATAKMLDDTPSDATTTATTTNPGIRPRLRPVR